MSETYFPTFRKLYNTSYGDLFRFRLSGRLNWRRRLTESELPADVQATIRDVLRKTRLLRHEKSQVCDELMAHFQDGNSTGKSFEDLLSTFGDHEVAASLIRRSKKRNRSLFLQAVQTAKWCAIGLLVAYLGMTAYFLAGRPTPNVDFLSKLNQVALTAPESDKAWPIYREAWIKYDFLNHQTNNNFREIFVTDEPGNVTRLLKPSDANWPAAVSYLTERSDLLDTFRAASKKPVLGLELKANYKDYALNDLRALYPHALDEAGKLVESLDQPNPKHPGDVLDDCLIGTLLPHIQELRTVARFLVVDTRLAIQQGDHNRSVENIEAIFGVAHQASEDPVLVCGLVGLAISSIGFDLIEETITEHPEFLTADQLGQLQTTVSKLPTRQMIKFDGERWLFQDILQRVYTDDGNGDGRMTWQGIQAMKLTLPDLAGNAEQLDEPALTTAFRVLSGPASMVSLASRKEMKDKYDELFAELEASFNQPVASVDLNSMELKIQDAIDEDSRYSLIGMILPALAGIRITLETRLARQTAVELAIAAERFRRETGDWPANTAELTPQFIQTLPLDPLNEQPLQLAMVDDQLTIYSVGNNLQDDGGSPLTEPVTGKTVINFRFESSTLYPDNGDWILWPQRNE